jgi:putative sigma-54 modulation protein
MFSNSQTNQANVVYKRKDGNYGWIEPNIKE